MGKILLDLQVSIGIAVAPEHGTTAEALLQGADVAVYMAKRSAGGCAISNIYWAG